MIAARIMLNIRDPVVSQPQVDRILGPRGENTHLFSDLRFTISSVIEGQALETWVGLRTSRKSPGRTKAWGRLGGGQDVGARHRGMRQILEGDGVP